MMPRNFYLIIVSLVTVLMLCDFVHSFFDPISISAGIIVGGASLYNHEKVWELTYCQFKECCINAHIPADMTG